MTLRRRTTLVPSTVQSSPSIMATSHPLQSSEAATDAADKDDRSEHPFETPLQQHTANASSSGSWTATQPVQRGPPKSSYYTGPPPPGSAFGTPPLAIIGKHWPREMVRIERDYTMSACHVPQFYTSFPLELEGRLTPTQFTELINDINALCIRANNAAWAALDNGLAVLTLWISPFLLGTHFGRVSVSPCHRLLSTLERSVTAWLTVVSFCLCVS